MSHNPNFLNYFQNNFTFQNAVPRFYFQPPPLPPPIIQTPQISDAEFISEFENKMSLPKPKFKVNMKNVWKIKADVTNLVLGHFYIKKQERKLMANINASDEEWVAMMEGVKTNKAVIQQCIVKIVESCLRMNERVVAKRDEKRLRLRKQRKVLKAESEERLRQKQETSRKIDENLKKIKDNIQKAKQDEEAKLRADVVLKEVRRKKHDAKRSIVKLESLIKLRKARQNTAKGKGQVLSSIHSNTFQENIEKLKSLWEHKLIAYEKEEVELCASLQQQHSGTAEDGQANSVAKWRKALFGGRENPQVDFKGDLDRFVGVRAQWDQYIDDGPESNPIPIGWVFPDIEK